MVDDPAVPIADALRRAVPLLAVMTVLGAGLSDPGTPVERVISVVAAVPFFVWAWRPHWMPPVALVAVVGACELLALRSGELEPLLFLMSIAAVVLATFEGSTRLLVVGTVLAVATPVLAELVAEDEILYGVWVMGIALPLLLGRVSRWQVETAAELAEARQEIARQTVLETQRRIARDVHDLVGHGLAAMLLHVTGARHVLRRDPDEADAALVEAEAVGRRSLQELRHTLHLLRSSDGDGDAAGGGPGARAHEPPVPDATDIATAVQAARAAGVDTELRVQGDVAQIDPIVGLSLHRVVEEALVNARRHAPRAVTDVAVVVGEDAVVLTVDSVGELGPDPARAAPDPVDPGGPRYGLVGMRERMAAVGGEIEVGPTPTGWLVRCRVPLGAEGA
ncbi:MAG TPA: histidine kinase [Acidimicrobiales bacterium]|nr:histidine kinase [Acidimicrobiales bacterium]